MKSNHASPEFSFDQELLKSAIGRELDAMETTLNWSVGVAIGIWLTSLQQAQMFRLIGFEITRNQLFIALTVIYLSVNVSVFINLTRIRVILTLLDKDNFIKGLLVAATHRFIFNPFSFYGGSSIARLSNCFGLPSLIAVWWICMNLVAASSLDFSSTNSQRWLTSTLEGLLFACCIAQAVRMLACYRTIHHRLAKIDPALCTLVRKTGMDRVYAGIAVAIVGLSRTLFLIFGAWH